jgi:3alpha(or 20beta)-hydroxysteroid dehydrogenase
MGRLEGKVAIVTGAARGIGAETARRFVREGAQVLLGDVRDELGEKAAAELGPAALYRRLDVRSEADWAAAVAAARERFGALHVLVNNAAILEVATIEETTRAQLAELLDVNLIGPFLGTQAVLPALRVAGGGSIVNVASIDALEGEVGVAGYAASKWGLRGLTKCAALELGRFGVRVNAVHPGGGNPEMREPAMRRVQEELRRGTQIDFSGAPRRPLGRGVTLAEIASVILFLASDESSFCSGGDFAVDGAFTAGHIVPGAPGTY